MPEEATPPRIEPVHPAATPLPESRSNAAPAVDGKRVLARLVAAVSGSVVLAAGVTALMIALTRHPQWWSGWVAALIVSAIATLLSLGPIAAGLFFGTQFTAYGYLAGAVIRILVTLAGCLAAVLLVRTPPAPTLLLTVPLYFAQLAAESLVLSRAFWPRK